MKNRYSIRHLSSDMLRLILAVTFILSGFLKGVNLQSAADLVRNYCALIGFSPKYPYLMAFAICTGEIFIGFLAFDRRIYAKLHLAYTAVVCFFIFVTSINLISPFGSIESCGCFGELIHLDPVQSFIKNLFLFISCLILDFIIMRNNITGDYDLFYPVRGDILLSLLAAVIPLLFSMFFMNRLLSNHYFPVYSTLSCLSILSILIFRKARSHIFNYKRFYNE